MSLRKIAGTFTKVGIAATLDPAVILNPHVLLDPMERLEA